MNEHDDDLQQRARRHLDAACDGIDAGTRDALATARARARIAAAQDAAPRRDARGWLAAGSLVAAGFAAFLLLPLHAGNRGEAAFSEPDVLLTSDTDTAVADDLAFVAWLEENDAST